MSSILNYWPIENSPPRKTQVDVLNWIENLPNEIKYVICEIPVGGGKSPLALNMSMWLDNLTKQVKNSKGDCFILTPQKILQKQYEDSFPKLAFSLYGKANYQCSTKGTNCEIGSLIKPKCGMCAHKEAYQTACVSSNLIMNYTLAITYKLTPADLMKKRKLMVFDECHNIEKQLIDLFGVFISEKSCKRYVCSYKKPESLKEAIGFIRDVYRPAVDNYILRQDAAVEEILIKMSHGKSVTKDESILVEEVEKAKKHLVMIDLLLDKPVTDMDMTHVLIDHPESFEIKELYAKEIFTDFFDKTAEKFLFMSSTILDKDSFCSDLGIDPSQTAFISMPSEFPVDNRLVIFNPVAKMVYGWDKPERKADRDALINEIINVCKSYHPTDNGIIHTGSYQISSFLVRELSKKIPHKIYHHNADTEIGRESAINGFISDDISGPKILISPSITEGLDLKEDLGRFSIIAKTPFPSLADKWVKKRADLSQKWYNLQAIKSVIQASGRVVRSKDDWGVTYILDHSFGSLYNRMKSYVPSWWRESFNEID